MCSTVVLSLGYEPSELPGGFHHSEATVVQFDLETEKTVVALKEIINSIGLRLHVVDFELYKESVRKHTISTLLLDYIVGHVLRSLGIDSKSITAVAINWEHDHASYVHFSELIALWAARHPKIVNLRDAARMPHLRAS